MQTKAADHIYNSKSTKKEIAARDQEENIKLGLQQSNEYDAHHPSLVLTGEAKQMQNNAYVPRKFRLIDISLKILFAPGL